MQTPGVKQPQCGMRDLLKSHGGGSDYSAPCMLPVGPKGTHKGDHKTNKGYTWKPSDTDRRIGYDNVVREQ